MPAPTPRAPNTIPGAPTEIRVVATLAPGSTLVTISWNSLAGATYRVWFKNTLDAPSWSNLRDVPSTGAVTSTTDTLTGTAQRFYRIEQVGF